MNGLFYLDEIFYSENSPYLYDIDTFSSKDSYLVQLSK